MVARKGEKPKGLTPKLFSTWLLPHEAVSRVADHVPEKMARGSIAQYLQALSLRAAARRAALSGTLGSTTHKDLFEIPPDYWGHLQFTEDFWDNGSAIFKVSSLGNLEMFGVDLVRCIGIRIEPNGIDVLIHELLEDRPPTRSQDSNASIAPKAADDSGHTKRKPKAVAAKTVQTTRRGPPPKAWWDDLWIEMFRQIHFGEFTPKRLVDLENRMHDWLASRGESASEKTIRNAAKKLFDALQE